MRALRRDPAATISPELLTRAGWLTRPTDFLTSFGLTVFCILDSHDQYSITNAHSFSRNYFVLRLKNICWKKNRNAALRDG